MRTEEISRFFSYFILFWYIFMSSSESYQISDIQTCSNAIWTTDHWNASTPRYLQQCVSLMLEVNPVNNHLTSGKIPGITPFKFWTPKKSVLKCYYREFSLNANFSQRLQKELTFQAHNKRWYRKTLILPKLDLEIVGKPFNMFQLHFFHLQYGYQ